MAEPVVVKSARFVVRGFSAATMAQAAENVIGANLQRWDAAQLVGGGSAPPLKKPTKRTVRTMSSSDSRVQVVIESGENKTIRDLKRTGQLRAAIKVLSSAINRASLGPISGIHQGSVMVKRIYRNGELVSEKKLFAGPNKRRLNFHGLLAINNWRARMWGVGPKEERAISKSLEGQPFVVTEPKANG